jgi:hypothetical protein
MAKNKRSSVRGQTNTNIHPHGSIMRSLVTSDTVENRARELALIAGREPNRVTASDRIQAKKELLGDDSADDAVDDTGITPSGMGAPPTSTGKRIEPQLPTDDQTEIQMVQEGLDEAEHDEMLQAAKTRTKNQG